MSTLQAVCLYSFGGPGGVEALGSGLTRMKMGDEIFSRPGLSCSRAYAEFIVIKESEPALKPKSTSPFPAATGGVGHFTVQLAEWNGAHVIGPASARMA